MKQISTTHRSRGWTTEDEIAFIEGLARGAANADMLRGYLRSLRNRANFGTINAETVIQHAQKLLSDAERAAA
jgi:hypothetical protein